MDINGMVEGALIPKLMAFEAGNEFPQRERTLEGQPPPPCWNATSTLRDTP